MKLGRTPDRSFFAGLGVGVAGLLLYLAVVAGLAHWAVRPGVEELDFILHLAIIYIGLGQCAYLIPIVWFWRKKRSQLQGLAAAAALTFALGCYPLYLFSQVPRSPLEDPGFFEDSFEIQARWSSVPEATRREFKAILVKNIRIAPAARRQAAGKNDPMTFVMAEPGEPYQDSDLGADESLPYRRLIFAGESPRRAFLFYEFGGNSLCRLVVLEKAGPQLKYSWATLIAGRFRSFYLLKLWLKTWPRYHKGSILRYL
jgi:hypothetical protein